MLVRLLAAMMLVLAQALPLAAGPPAAADVVAVLRVPEMIAVMQDEGLAYGAELKAQLFPQSNGSLWDRNVARIYDLPAMQARFGAAFAERLGTDPAELAAITAFFGSERGQRILGLEIAARRALLDKTVEEAAKAGVERMRDAADPRIGLLERFAAANDLIEQNVSGALNANLAFYRGMAEGGGFPGNGMTAEDMLAEVQAQQDDVRAETIAWLYPFLMLAYQPLPDDDLMAYIAFSETAAGGRMNTAMFGAFDVVFAGISHDLGQAAAEMLTGQDI